MMNNKQVPLGKKGYIREQLHNIPGMLHFTKHFVHLQRRRMRQLRSEAPYECMRDRVQQLKQGLKSLPLLM